MALVGVQREHPFAGAIKTFYEESRDINNQNYFEKNYVSSISTNNNNNNSNNNDHIGSALRNKKKWENGLDCWVDMSFFSHLLAQSLPLISTRRRQRQSTTAPATTTTAAMTTTAAEAQQIQPMEEQEQIELVVISDDEEVKEDMNNKEATEEIKEG